jgi:hypothetical protein
MHLMRQGPLIWAELSAVEMLLLLEEEEEA